jgi:hypothetical protein
LRRIIKNYVRNFHLRKRNDLNSTLILSSFLDWTTTRLL